MTNIYEKVFFLIQNESNYLFPRRLLLTSGSFTSFCGFSSFFALRHSIGYRMIPSLISKSKIVKLNLCALHSRFYLGQCIFEFFVFNLLLEHFSATFLTSLNLIKHGSSSKSSSIESTGKTPTMDTNRYLWLPS